MRITNKIIQNNSLSNINLNKTLQDTLSTQISTEKKIARPSDDPIVALRSLRLRTSVNQTEQYREKNAEDAESWLQITEDAITTLTDIITDIRKQYVKGASETLTPADRQIVLENLQALADEVYNTGNADFAGRSVFTGYRTDSDLTFQENEELKYSIEEKWTAEDEGTLKVSSVKHTYYNDGVTNGNETEVSEEDIVRIRLSYNELSDGKDINLSINGKDYSASAQTNAYDYIKANPGKICYDAATGEIFVGKNALDAAKETAVEDITSVSVTYEKEKWNKGDLKPEHYFNCESTQTINGKEQTIKYDLNTSDGEIEYNIGVNQSLRINTKADECFNHDIVRDIDDIIEAINNVNNIDAKVTELTDKLGTLTEGTADYKTTQKELDAAKKAQTFLNEELTNQFSQGITNAEGYLRRTNLALTNCGTRGKRLELIQNRLDTQLSTLKELKSENEDVDMAETAVKLSSAQYAYDASLMATSKILQQNLLNYL